MSRGGGRIDPVTYARLYLVYGDLEGNDYNVIESGIANPALMKAGVQGLVQRYKKSDYAIN